MEWSSWWDCSLPFSIIKELEYDFVFGGNWILTGDSSSFIQGCDDDPPKFGPFLFLNRDLMLWCNNDTSCWSSQTSSHFWCFFMTTCGFWSATKTPGPPRGDRPVTGGSDVIQRRLQRTKFKKKKYKRCWRPEVVKMSRWIIDIKELWHHLFRYNCKMMILTSVTFHKYVYKVSNYERIK